MKQPDKPDKPIRSARKARVVQGFGVSGQERTKFRGDSLDGTHRGFYWVIFSEGQGIFQWRMGGLVGYAGPTLAHVLRVLKRTARNMHELQEAHGGDVPAESLGALRMLLRWEQRALQGRLTIEGPVGRGETQFYRVTEKDE